MGESNITSWHVVDRGAMGIVTCWFADLRRRFQHIHPGRLLLLLVLSLMMARFPAAAIIAIAVAWGVGVTLAVQEIAALLLLTSILILPRAGFLIPGVLIPLPVGLLVVGLLSVKTLGGWLATRFESLSRTPINRIYPFFFLWGTVGIAQSVLRGLNLKAAAFEYVLYILSGFAFFAAVHVLVKSNRHVVTRLFLAAALLVPVYGILQMPFGEKIIIPRLTHNAGSEISLQQQLRPTAFRHVLSTYGDPNALAGNLVAFSCVGLAGLSLRGARRRWRLQMGGLFALNTICLILTLSRSGMAGLLIAGAATLGTGRCKYLLVAAAVLALLFAVLPYIMGHPTVLYIRYGAEILEDLGEKTDPRLFSPLDAANGAIHYPLGIGFGGMVDFGQRGAITKDPGFVYSKTNVKESVFVWVDSFYVRMILALGLPGLVLFMWIYVLLVRHCFRVSRRPDLSSFEYALSRGIGGGLVCLPVIWAFNNTFMLPGGGFNYWVMAGIVTAIGLQHEGNKVRGERE